MKINSKNEKLKIDEDKLKEQIDRKLFIPEEINDKLYKDFRNQILSQEISLNKSGKSESNIFI